MTTTGNPILMLQRDRNVELPSGRAVPVSVEGDQYTFDFMKVAVNIARRESEPENVLADLLYGWFGEDAGLPGSHHRVELWREGDQWHAAPHVSISNDRERPGSTA